MTWSMDALGRHRRWLLAAATYNVVWGVTTFLAPDALFRLVGIPPVVDSATWRLVGLLVLLYAPAYLVAARRPSRSPVLVGIALLGHLAGPVGFVIGLLSGSLPLAFGWLIVINDLVWLPFFALFVRDWTRYRPADA